MKSSKKIIVLAIAGALVGVTGISTSQEISLPTFTGKAAGIIYTDSAAKEDSNKSKVDAPKPPVKAEPVKVEAPKPPVKAEPVKVEAPKPPVKAEPVKVEAPKPPVKAEPVKVEAPKPPVKAEPVKVEAPKLPVKAEPVKVEAPKPPVKAEPVKVEAPKPPVKAEPVKVEAPKLPVKAEPAKVEAPKPPVKTAPQKSSFNNSKSTFNLISVIKFKEGAMRKLESGSDISKTVNALQDIKATDKVWVKGMVVAGENKDLDVEEYGVHRADTARDLLKEAGYVTEIRILHSKEYQHSQVNVYVEHNAYVKTN